MTISIVQSAHTTGSLPVSFASGVTAGNSVFILLGGYDNTGTPSTSNPTLGGGAVTGATAFFNPGGTNGVGSGGSPGAYSCIWMLPNCPGGSTSVNITFTQTGGAATGVMIFEVSGLGASPTLDQSTSGTATTGTTVNTGTTGAITAAPELVLCADQTYGGSSNQPSGGWTTTNISGNTWAGYQIPVSSGGTYNWTQTVTSGPWSACIATVAPTGGSAVSGTVQPVATLQTPRRKPGRAVVQFTPVTTVNVGNGPAGKVQPLTARPAPRRRPSRAVVGFIPVTTTNGPAEPHPQHGTPSSDEARGWKRWLLWGP